MTEVTTVAHRELKQKAKERFAGNQDKIEALYLEMANCLMVEVSVDILEKAPTAKTLELYHMLEENNEYNSVSPKALLDAGGTDLLDEDESLATWLEDLLCNFSGDYLILLPESVDLESQLQVLS